MEQVLTAAALLGLAVPSTDSAVQLVLPLAGDAERKVVTYACEGAENPFPVEYINAAPNFLAVIPVGGVRLVFAGVLAADGSRYVAGPFEWWSRGTDATFADQRMTEAEPVACTEKNETP
jgi:membrane-bound inhibitor of C-type lysozyme